MTTPKTTPKRRSPRSPGGQNQLGKSVRRSPRNFRSPRSMMSPRARRVSSKSPKKKSSAKKKDDYSRRHPLEVDGLVPLYAVLSKKSKSMSVVHMVRIPDTVLLEHSIPTAWFYSTRKPHHGTIDEYIQRKTAREMEAVAIEQTVGKENEVVRGCRVDIVASFYFTQRVQGVDTTVVRFFDQKELNEFIFHEHPKPDGILQKFVMPKGKETNTVIMAVWSPSVCMVRCRRNMNCLTDKSLSRAERAVTFDGPTHHSVESNCAPRTTELIKQHCDAIAEHFHDVEGMRLSRLVLYFKMDDDNFPWLLWCGCLRVEGADSAPIEVAQPFTAIDAQPEDDFKFRPALPEAEADALLKSLDKNPFVDTTTTSANQNRFRRSPSPRSRNQSPRSPSPPRLKLPQIGVTSPATPNPSMLFDATPTNTNAVVLPAASETAKTRETRRVVEAIRRLQRHWHSVTPVISERYNALIEKKLTCLRIVEDLEYEVYTHLELAAAAENENKNDPMKPEPEPFYFTLPHVLLTHLSAEGVAAVVKELCVERTAPMSMEVMYKPNVTMGFISMVVTRTKSRIEAFFVDDLHALKCEAWPHVERQAIEIALEAGEINTM